MTKPSLPKIEITVEIPFHDVDSARIAWHGHYAKYLELARCELLESFNYNYPEMLESGYFWPVIDMHIRYVAPCRFQQKVRITAELLEWENRLKIQYRLYDAESGQRLTKATTSQVAVRIDTEEMLLASPAIVAEKLGLVNE